SIFPFRLQSKCGNMGGWFSKKKKDDDDDDDDVEEEEEKEYTKIDTGDSTAVKYLLDDKVGEYFREEQTSTVTINYTVDNLKLLLMAFAITVSAGTHFSGDGDKCVVRAKFPRFQEYYTLRIESVAQPKHVEEKLYVGKFFDEEGHFDEGTFKKAVGALTTKFTKVKTT
ncbi:hypothetical protein DYB34_013150, partial [Aphanomyces astaci]